MAGAGSYVAIVVVAIWMLGDEAWRLFTAVTLVFAGVTGPFLGAGFVWMIVRSTNRRNDSICSKQSGEG
jgi:hypothetical protein